MLNKYLNPTNIYLNRTKFDSVGIIVTLIILLTTYFIFASVTAVGYESKVKPVLEGLITSNEKIETGFDAKFDKEKGNMNIGTDKVVVVDGKDFKYGFTKEQRVPKELDKEEFILFTEQGTLYHVDQAKIYLPYYALNLNDKTTFDDLSVFYKGALTYVDNMINDYKVFSTNKLAYMISGAFGQYIQLILFAVLLGKITTFITKRKVSWRELFNLAIATLVLPSLLYLGGSIFSMSPQTITNIVLILSTILLFFALKNGLDHENSLK